MNFQKRPKIELHRHLELSFPHDFLKREALKKGFPVEEQSQFEKHFLIKEPMKDLGSVLNRFLDTQKLLSSVEILEEGSFLVCKNAFEIENIRLLELRYSPTFVCDGHDLTFQQAHDAIVRGLKRAEKQFPKMKTGLICIIQRTLPLKTSEGVIDFVIDNKDTFLGLDLADNEVGFEPQPFSPVFQKAKKKGLRITIHAGEASVPEASSYVQDAVNFLGAERIGHGIQIINNEDVLNWVVKNKIPLEVCLTSNYLTQAFKTFETHPFKKLLQKQVKVTINTDDPSIFDTDMNKEYELLESYQDFTEDDFKVCEKNAFEACFIPGKEDVWPVV